MDWQKRITERIQQLEQELAAYVEQANQQIAAQQGAIAALQQLLQDVGVGATDDTATKEPAAD